MARIYHLAFDWCSCLLPETLSDDEESRIRVKTSFQGMFDEKRSNFRTKCKSEARKNVGKVSSDELMTDYVYLSLK